MPILPIDLQTIFVQIGNVGREQAVQRDIAPLQQTLQANQIVQQTYRQDRSVNVARDTREGERIVTEERRRQPKGGEEGRKRSGQAGQEEGQTDKGEGVFRDPALGTHIDVVR